MAAPDEGIEAEEETGMQWELNDGTAQVGPLEEDHVIRMLQRGLLPQTVVRAVGETEWRSPRSHAAFAIAMEHAKRGMEQAPSAGASPVAAAPVPAQASRVAKSEFVGMGCVVQGVGVLAPFLLPWILWVFLGEQATIVGLVFGLCAAPACYVVGRKMAVTWTCGACGNRLTTSDARLCPVCRAQLL